MMTNLKYETNVDVDKCQGSKKGHDWVYRGIDTSNKMTWQCANCQGLRTSQLHDNKITKETIREVAQVSQPAKKTNNPLVAVKKWLIDDTLEDIKKIGTKKKK